MICSDCKLKQHCLKVYGSAYSPPCGHDYKPDKADDLTTFYDVVKDIRVEMTEPEISTHKVLMALPHRALVDSLIAHRRHCPLCKAEPSEPPDA